MKGIFLALGLAASAVPALAQEHGHNLDKSAFSGFHEIRPLSRIDATAAAQKVNQQFPGMYVSVDKLNGSFTDIFGKAMPVQGTSVENKLALLFAHQLKSLGINASDWVRKGSFLGDHASFINYEQVINGHPVVFANLKFRFTKDGQLERIKMKNYGKPNLSFSPSLSEATAAQKVEQDLSGVTIEHTTIETAWSWFPVPTASGYELRPAYAFNVKGRTESLPVDLIGYVDAISGEILYRSNRVKETINKTVEGGVYKQNPLQAATNEPLANLKVTISGTDYYTDTAGYLNVTSLNTPVSTTVKLEGKWAKVQAQASGGVTPNFTNVITVNGATYPFPVTSPSSIRHVNAYYHVNRVHDFMKNFYPTFTAMDNPLPTNVDVSGSCNAFYNGSSINFYAAGNGCNSFALCGDIVYHEYGHGINDNFYGFMGQNTMFNGALNEGYADIWAIGITKDPVLGKGSTPTGGIIRRYDQAPKVFPQDLVGQVHADGEIIAGAWWDVALNLNSPDTMSILFSKTLFDTPDGPTGTEGVVYHDVLVSALLNDDNDNNLNNFTPHFSQIVQAFARHGIYLLGDAEVVHDDIPNQPAGVPVSINANLNILTPAFFQSLKLYYKPRGGQWDSVAMTSTGGSGFTGQIPAQQPGTIIDYYFGVFDIDTILNMTAPGGYRANVSLATVSIPYQFGIGLDQKADINFNNPLTGWTVGAATGDNATGGIWIQAKPVGSWESPIQKLGPVQPDLDHSPDTMNMCLVTGNAPSPVSGTGVADVDNGKTSVITPTFDVTGFTQPVVEYWRWYSNNAGSNPGQDLWTVFIKDPASTLWILKVDNTTRTDNRWRRRIFHLSQYLPGSSQFMLKFQAEDANPGSVVEAAVDDIFIYDKGVINSVDDIADAKASVYPNPANREINVRFAQAATGYISLHDLMGKQLNNIEMSGGTEYRLNTSNLPAGTYFISIKTDKFVQAQKVVITH
jgi:hypothetical protein